MADTFQYHFYSGNYSRTCPDRYPFLEGYRFYNQSYPGSSMGIMDRI